MNSNTFNAVKIWNDYENARNYKTSQEIYDNARKNERYYAGDQWHGIKDSGLNLITLNFISQLIDVKVSSIMANPVSIVRKLDDMDYENVKLETLTKAMQLMDKKNWERLQMEYVNEEVLLKGALSGVGGTYWFWDDSIKTGNTFLTKGDLNYNTIDAVDLYVSNPNCKEIQKQDWVMFSKRMTQKQARELAIKMGTPENEISMITSDEDTQYEGYDKADTEQENENGKNVTVLTTMWKEKGNVWYCVSTKSVKFGKPINSELTLYPIAIMPWLVRQKTIYATAEVTSIRDNQKSANKTAAIRDLSTQLMGMPKIVYNKNSIASVSSKAGGAYGVDLPASQQVSGLLEYIQPTATSVDFDKNIDTTIRLTKDLKGINDNVVGASRPENTSAIIAQQRAAGVPLESIKRRFWRYILDVAEIWKDFYENKYDMTRKLKDEDGNTVDFIGTEAKDMYMKSSVDIGESLHVTEETTINELKNWLDAGYITFDEYLELFPRNLIPGTEKLKEKREQMKQQPSQEQEQPMNQDFMSTLPENVQQIIMSNPNADALMQELMGMTEEERNQAIQRLM